MWSIWEFLWQNTFLSSQNLEAELSKKCDELRQLFLLQQSQQQQQNSSQQDDSTSNTPSPPSSTTRALQKSGTFNEEEDSSDDSSTCSTGNGPPRSGNVGGVGGPGESGSEKDSSVAAGSNNSSKPTKQDTTLLFSKELESLKENLQDQVGGSNFFALIWFGIGALATPIREQLLQFSCVCVYSCCSFKSTSKAVSHDFYAIKCGLTIVSYGLGIVARKCDKDCTYCPYTLQSMRDIYFVHGHRISRKSSTIL